MTRSCNVVILGGGPAGSATGISLARVGLSAVIVERSRYETTRIGETLPPAIKQLLVTLDVWETFLRASHLSSPAIQSAWGSDVLESQDHIFNPYGPSWHVDRARFDEMLARRAEEAGVTLFTEAELLSCVDEGKGHWRVAILSDGRERCIESRFLVDASGRSSSIALKQGAKRIAVDHLIGVVGILDSAGRETVSERPLLIEAGEQGWWYSAPLPGARMVLAYMTDADLYAQGQREHADFWMQEFEKSTHLRSHVAGFDPSNARLRVVSANSSRLTQTADGNWLAVGDAAFAFDPLAGQGLYKALESGILGAKAIVEYLNGTVSTLGEHDEGRQRDFARYLQFRRAFYARETRWPLSTFWRRRAALQT